MKAPKCRLCGERHYGTCTQFEDKPQKRVHNEPKTPKGVHKKLKPDVECVHKPEGVRQVGIRQLRQNLTAELADLPFEVTRNGKVIARVK